MLWRESIACNNVLLTVQSTVSCRHEYHLQNTGCIVIIYGCCHLTVDGQYNSSPIWLKPHRTLWNKTKTKHWNSLKQFTACFGLISLFIRYQLRHLRSIRRSVNDDANVLSCARVHRKSRWLLQRCPVRRPCEGYRLYYTLLLEWSLAFVEMSTPLRHCVSVTHYIGCRCHSAYCLQLLCWRSIVTDQPTKIF